MKTYPWSKLKSELADLLSTQVNATFAQSLEPSEIMDKLESPPDANMGDFALPCFFLAKSLRMAPPQIAQKIADNLDLASQPGFEWVQTKGPYLNIKIDQAFLSQKTLEEIQTSKENYGKTELGQNKTIAIDFSSPNIAKHLAFHHLRSAVIGNALCNIFRALGYNTIGINHLGDWGTQFGKLITAFLKWGPKNIQDLGEDPISTLNELYVRFQKESKEDPTLVDEARAWFKKLEQGDPQAKKLWQSFRDVSLQTFERVYQRLNITFTETTGESFFVDQIPKVLETLAEKKLSSLSEGALIVDLSSDDMPPCLLKKADESTLYATRDLAAAIYRAEKYKFHRLLYVVDTGQSLHFKQFFRVLERAGFDWASQLEHVNFGIIKFQGTKTRTREGNIILLEDVLDEAIERIDQKIKEKNPDLENRADVAKAVGIGAIIFADLSGRRARDINFDWQEILNFDGRTGPYVQYSYARANSILRKSGVKKLPAPKRDQIQKLALPEEWLLVRHLAQYPLAIEKAAALSEPSYVADRLLEICEAFHRYHALGKQNPAHRVLTEDKALTEARLILTQCTAQVLKNGLELLGIQAPQAM